MLNQFLQSLIYDNFGKMRKGRLSVLTDCKKTAVSNAAERSIKYQVLFFYKG